MNLKSSYLIKSYLNLITTYFLLVDKAARIYNCAYSRQVPSSKQEILSETRKISKNLIIRNPCEKSQE